MLLLISCLLLQVKFINLHKCQLLLFKLLKQTIKLEKKKTPVCI